MKIENVWAGHVSIKAIPVSQRFGYKITVRIDCLGWIDNDISSSVQAYMLMLMLIHCFINLNNWTNMCSLNFTWRTKHLWMTFVFDTFERVFTNILSVAMNTLFCYWVLCFILGTNLNMFCELDKVLQPLLWFSHCDWWASDD